MLVVLSPAAGAPGTPEGRGEPGASVLCEGAGRNVGAAEEFPLRLELRGVWTDREPWTEGVSGAARGSHDFCRR